MGPRGLFEGGPAYRLGALHLAGLFLQDLFDDLQHVFLFLFTKHCRAFDKKRCASSFFN